MSLSNQSIPIVPIPRPSATETLENLYNNIKTSVPGNTAGIAGGIRWHLTNKNIGTYAWGKSALAGAGNNGTYITTNTLVKGASTTNGAYVRTWQPKEFVANHPVKVTSFTNAALQYATRNYSLNTVSYGRGPIAAASVKTSVYGRVATL